MDRESFANYLDSSWLDFRQRLLAVYPESSGGFEHNGRLISTGSSDDNEVGGAMMRNLDGTPVVLKQEYENAGFLTSNGSNLSCMSLSEDEQEPTTNEGARNQDSSHLINSALADFTAKEVESVRNRLRLRLGAVSSNHLVSGKSLLEAVQSLGLTKYSEEDMNGMVNQLADFINLRFEAPRKKRNSGISNGIVNGLFKQPNPKELGKPIWEYPQDVIPQKRTSSVSVSVSRTVLQRSESSMRSKGQYNVVPARALVDCFLADDEEAMKKIFTAKYINQYLSMREILLAGDTNRLVAELTFVRINDLAAPPEPVHPLTYIEPIVALLIVGNGVMIGFQTDPCCEDLSVWPYIELAFALLLVIEILLRVHLLRCRQYWCGQDKFWNWFDLFLVGVGIADLTLQWVGTESDVQGTSLLRFCRLIRLVRIVKVFRIRVMRDLRLMVKGLIAGIRTLCLAFILLFTVLYVISGFATMTIGNNPKAEALDVDKYFKNIPASMFTAFRCFTGECVNREGQPIHEMLAEAFQLPFIIGYVACYMLVTMGIFNVILAVYVDITMKAAKENDAVTAEQYARESIRIARTTRELLKKFSLAHHVYHVNDGEEREEEDWEDSTKAKLAKMKTTNVFAEDGGHDKIAITKELFLLVVQDPSVQALMDELDLPPDRANLFEIIDADGSGTLQITELLHGLLKIRGEINKSDAVASLLATRAVQNQVQEFEEKVAEDLEQIRAQMTQLAQRERFPFRMSNNSVQRQSPKAMKPKKSPRLNDDARPPSRPESPSAVGRGPPLPPLHGDGPLQKVAASGVAMPFQSPLKLPQKPHVIEVEDAPPCG